LELMKGVHRIPSYANCVLLVDDKVLLFDTSAKAAADDIVAYLPKARLQWRDLAAVIVTHTHPDHVNGLAALKGRAPQARVACHEADAPFVSKQQPSYPHKPLNGKPSPWQAVPVDDRLRDGQRYEGLLVLHCPGHTPGSIALLDEDRSLLIAGDTVATDPESCADPALLRQVGVAPMSDAYNSDPRAHRDGIRKLAKHTFDVAIPGHGEPLTGGASAKVQALARRL
jgi:glyoxylase-like metal-dependent hydrolase (beta-lactamase superfamily II)